METETFVYGVCNFYDLKQNSWSGALQTLDAIEDKGLENEFISFLNDILEMNNNEGKAWTETQLNDFIWFDTDYIEECLGCKLWEE